MATADDGPDAGVRQALGETRRKVTASVALLQCGWPGLDDPRNAGLGGRIDRLLAALRESDARCAGNRPPGHTPTWADARRRFAASLRTLADELDAAEGTADGR